MSKFPEPKDIYNSKDTVKFTLEPDPVWKKILIFLFKAALLFIAVLIIGIYIEALLQRDYYLEQFVHCKVQNGQENDLLKQDIIMRRFYGGKVNHESQIQTAIFMYLQARKITAWRQNNHAVPMLRNGQIIYRKNNFSMRGVGDITGILPDGKRLEIEVKDAGKKQSPEQVQFEAMIKAHGGIYILAYDYEDVDKVLIEKGYVTKR